MVERLRGMDPQQQALDAGSSGIVRFLTDLGALGGREGGIASPARVPPPGRGPLRGDPLRMTEVGVVGGDPRRGGRPVQPEFRPPQMPGYDEVFGGIPTPQGGGAGGGFSAAVGLGSLAQAQSRAAQAIGALEGQFEARKNELREQYQFSETVEERASIQHVLAVIEAQRDAGTKVIERVYTQAMDRAQAQSADVRAMGQAAGERTAETFREAAERSEAAMQRLSGRVGGAMGAGGEPLSDVVVGDITDFEKRAAIEQAFDERMFGVTADDISFLGAAMGPEMGAQVGGLQRIGAETSALASIGHQREVNRRIAQERGQFATGLQQLMGQFDQRRFGLEDQQIGLLAQAAQMQQQASQFGAGRADQFALEEWRARRQFAEQQAAAQFQRDQQRAQEGQFAEALRGMGVDAPTSRFATTLGLAEALAGMLLNQRFDPLQQLLD